MTEAEGSGLLDLLRQEVADARDDDRIMFTHYAAIISVAVLVIGALATVFYETCPKGYPECAGDPKLIPISFWIYVGAPVLPISLMAYAIFVSAILTLRSYYLRTLEKGIHELTGQADNLLPVPSWAHIQLEVTGQKHAGKAGHLNLLLIYYTVSAMILGCLFLALLKIPIWRYRIFALGIDGVLLAVLLKASLLNVSHGASLWNNALATLGARLERTAQGFPSEAAPQNERSLNGFLLLPRNKEELLKALFIPFCFVIGKWLHPGLPAVNAATIWYPLGFFLIFEFVIYQARYLLNDVWDRQADCRPGLIKKRFPCSLLKDKHAENAALRAALASFLARLLIAILFVGCIFPLEKWQWHVSFLLAVFLFALPYEFCRSKCNVAAKAGREWGASLWTFLMILLVGLGYGLRAIVGLWLAGIMDVIVLRLLFVSASLFGSAFVSLTWALESTRASREKLAATKGHLLLFQSLLSRAGVVIAPCEKVLEGWQSPLAPWSIFTTAATVGLTAFALFLIRVSFTQLAICRIEISEFPAFLVIVAAIAGIAAILPVGKAFLLTLVGLICVTVATHRLNVSILQSSVVATIALLPILVACNFRRMSYDDLPLFIETIANAPAAALDALYKWFTRER